MQDFNIITFKKMDKQNCEDCKVTSATPVDKLPLTMVWAPMQEYKCLYDWESALHRGTLFEELDKPFLMGRF